MRNKRIVLFVSIMFVLLTALVFLMSRASVKDTDINVVLESSSYAYLPKSAKNYIKEVYEDTGEVVLTEKNKKDGKPYLNPVYVSYLELSKEDRRKESIVPMPTVVDYMGTNKVYGAESIPSSYDSRNVSGKNYTTPVRDQGNFGLCWSFATMGTFESYLLKNNDTTYNSLTTKKFNERQLDYATSISGIKNYNNEYVSYIDRNLGEGGNFYISTVALANGVSYVDYSWKTYSDLDVEKMELHQVLNYENSQYEVNSTVNMPIVNFKTTTVNNSIKENYLNTIKKQIMDNGAVYVSTLWNWACNYYDVALGNEVVDVNNYCKYYQGGHAMTIIGWDDNIEYKYCDDDKYIHKDDAGEPSCKSFHTGKGVWILKNSWGTEVVNGVDPRPYPYLTYESMNSQYHFITDVNKTADRVWDNNYVLGATEGYESTIVQDTLSEQYIPVDEKLELVKFTSTSEDASYKVTVTGPDGSVSETAYTELPGLVTVDFSSYNFKVNSDSNVKISYTGGVYNYALDNFSVFTSNISNQVYIDLEEYNNERISEDSIRLFSYTKNIPSNSILNYKIIDRMGNDVTDNLTVSNNIVAENNINTLISGFSSLDEGEYTIKVYKDQTEVGSVEIVNFQMTGKGTSSDPYVIMNASQLNLIRNDLDAYYILGADIDLTEATRKGGKLNNLPSQAYENGHGWEAIIGFSGSFDGKGHTIKGLYQRTKIINKAGDEYSNMTSGYGGLFGSVSGGVKIKNVVLKDFDIECHTQCGPLIGYYHNAGNPTNAWTVEFSGIAVQNSVVGGVGFVDVGGVFGALKGNVESSLILNNIYADTYINSISGISEFGMLAYEVSAFKNLIISNIQMQGFMQGNNDDGSDSAVMVKSLSSYNVNVENVFSTVQTDKVGGLITNGFTISYYGGNTGTWNLKNIEMFNMEAKYDWFGRTGTGEGVTMSNATKYVSLDTDSLSNLTKSTNYSNWDNFSTYWNFIPIDGVARYPVLKVADFQYTEMPDITYTQVLNEYKNIYDYLSPNNNISNRLIFKSNNDNILKIDNEGKLIPQSDGIATVNVRNPYYDGYDRNVSVNVDYKPHYTVKFEANGAEGEMEQVELTPGDLFVIPDSEFTKSYYTFIGWNTKADGTGDRYNYNEVYSGGEDKEELILYAQWRGEQFDITFNANGGTVTPSSKTVYYGDVYGELPIPYKSGYGFNGWSANSLLVDSHDVVYYAEVYRTLKASWKANSYTIEFKPNGGVGYSDYMYAPIGEDKVLKENIYTRKNYSFVGWNTKADGSGTGYTNKQVINLTNVTNSILTLYAQWEVVEYRVTYDANGGVGEMDPTIILGDEQMELPINTFTREGYTFKEWNTKADGSGNSYSNQALIGVDNDMILYAIWDINKVLVTFNANDGSGKTTSQEVNWNTETSLSANTFSRNGFAFVKWNTKPDGSGTSYNNKQVIKIKDGLSLYAIWKETYSYKISTYIESNGMIDNIPIKTSIGDYLSKFTLNTGYSMEVSTVSGYINTGGKTKIYKDGKLYKEFTNVVRGDVNGDAKITSADYIKIRKHIMKTEVISNKVYFAAADANQDGKVTSADYVKIRKIIMGG